MTPSSRFAQRTHVLDANALVALFEDRKNAAEKVERLLEHALRQDLPLLMSAVNWGEVFYIIWRHHGEAKARDAEAKLQELPIAVISADQERASRAAALKQTHNLSYAEAFAAELALERRAWLVTAEENPLSVRTAALRKINLRRAEHFPSEEHRHCRPTLPPPPALPAAENTVYP